MVRIGIDPDIERSGFAVSNDSGIIRLESLPFYDLCTTLLQLSSGYRIEVSIEAGWLIKKSNWHPAQGRGVRDRIAKNVGENHATGKLLAQWCEKYDIPYELLPPRGKTKSAAFKRLTGWKGRTNQDQRDAAMLIFGRV